MPTIKPPKFTRPEVLRNLKPSSLRLLLAPFRDYLASRNFALEAEPLDCESLAAVLLTPTESSPPQLVEALEMVDMLTNAEALLSIECAWGRYVDEVREPGDAAGDVAVKLYQLHPEIVWREFDRRAVTQKRSLTSYLSPRRAQFHAPDAPRLAALEGEMAPWFAANARSGICRVRAFEAAGGWAFVIRHGDVLTRLSVIHDDGGSGLAIFRPERLDVAFFNCASREWRISGVGRRLEGVYRTAFGRVLHGDGGALRASSRYTLEPLRKGPAVLACGHDDPVQFAALRVLTMRLAEGVPLRLGVGEVFGVLSVLPPQVLATAVFTEAQFALKLSGPARRLQPIVVRPGRDCIAGATGHPAIEAWLEDRKFAIPDEHPGSLASH